MSNQRYERVLPNDEDDAVTPITPTSPPPSFRSRNSSPTSRNARVDQNLADTFDADGSDSDDDNDGDDRQRLMRGTPSTSSGEQSVAEGGNGDGRPAVVESRSTYAPVFAPTVAGRVYGGGSGSDGVFANLSAKPERGEKLDEHPPTYEQAAADAAPPYWETSILAPGLTGDEVYIEGLPVGSFFSFLWNAMISMSFQLVGFLLTYLLHTTHAAKNGSRAGLGITLIQYGFYMKGSGSVLSPTPTDPTYTVPPDPDSHDFDPNVVGQGNSNGTDKGQFDFGADWLSYLLMIIGWFVLIRSISDFIRARRMEQLVLQSPDRGLSQPVVAEGETPDRVV